MRPIRPLSVHARDPASGPQQDASSSETKTVGLPREDRGERWHNERTVVAGTSLDFRNRCDRTDPDHPGRRSPLWSAQEPGECARSGTQHVGIQKGNARGGGKSRERRKKGPGAAGIRQQIVHAHGGFGSLMTGCDTVVCRDGSETGPRIATAQDSAEYSYGGMNIRFKPDRSVPPRLGRGKGQGVRGVLPALVAAGITILCFSSVASPP